MKRTEAGLIALNILRYKIRRSGIELRPEEFNSKVDKMVALLGCKRDEAIAFFKTYLLPEVLRGCGVELNPTIPQPNNRDCIWAFRILCVEYFTSTSGLRNEITRISDAMNLDRSQVASLACFIIQQSLRRELGDKFEPETIEEA